MAQRTTPARFRPVQSLATPIGVVAGIEVPPAGIETPLDFDHRPPIGVVTPSEITGDPNWGKWMTGIEARLTY
ncbi:hypothetical protein CRG98_006971 [Punica granatum]|uniref:Uncharacterized protein n=1 Tax=Punica granatum TaxID=22663 RepID=A0A2I0KVU7_PUNGR|nr:hypothetical protein CRG98_006971 [Punica granatum]